MPAVKEFPSATRRTINVSGGRERASLPTFLDSQPRTTRGVARGGPDHLHGRAQRRRSVDGPLLQPDAISRSSWSTRSIEPPFATALKFFLTEGVTTQREAGRRLLKPARPVTVAEHLHAAALTPLGAGREGMRARRAGSKLRAA